MMPDDPRHLRYYRPRYCEGRAGQYSLAKATTLAKAEVAAHAKFLKTATLHHGLAWILWAQWTHDGKVVRECSLTGARHVQPVSYRLQPPPLPAPRPTREAA